MIVHANASLSWAVPTDSLASPFAHPSQLKYMMAQRSGKLGSED